ncbi:unnamed protein product [Laminaria digitata]
MVVVVLWRSPARRKILKGIGIEISEMEVSEIELSGIEMSGIGVSEMEISEIEEISRSEVEVTGSEIEVTGSEIEVSGSEIERSIDGTGERVIAESSGVSPCRRVGGVGSHCCRFAGGDRTTGLTAYVLLVLQREKEKMRLPAVYYSLSGGW